MISDKDKGESGYKMEELLPIVAGLARKYTSGESSSVTYEKAEQLMGAVVYCINEALNQEENAVAPTKKQDAEEVYNMGYKAVTDKVKRSVEIYNQVIKDFDDYDNECLHDTFIKGMPEFFKWYDAKYNPQNTILTLDYPVAYDLSGDSGIDAIFKYVNCIRLEQIFLSGFQRKEIITVLNRYSTDYRRMIDNICEVVYINVMAHILIGRDGSLGGLTKDDRELLEVKLSRMKGEEIAALLERLCKKVVESYYDNDEELFEYLKLINVNAAVRLKNAADNKCMEKLV